MIQEYVENGVNFYRVRVWHQSKITPAIGRVSRQKGGIKTLVEAQREEVRLRRECEVEVARIESQGILWGDLVERWYEHLFKTRVEINDLSPVSLKDYRGSILKWLGDYWTRPAIEVNAYVLAKMFQKMRDESKSFIHQRTLKTNIKSVFDYGIQSGLLRGVARSPTFEVALKKTGEKKPEILTIGEVQKLVDMAFREGHQWRYVWAVALLSGLRSGELYALKWENVDFENKILSIEWAYSSREKRIKETKGSYWRDVPLSSELERVLRALKDLRGNEETVFHRYREWTKGQQAEVLRTFCMGYGLKSIKFHTLRACFATHLLRMGVEAAKVMKVAGWRDLRTMQHYVRLAGIEIQGVTEPLKVFGDVELISPNVADSFSRQVVCENQEAMSA